MTVAPTRLLVMGAVRTFEPVNGYQIRRELISWNVQEWAHIQPGSIYSALSTLTNKGHLERHDLLDGGREVAVYTTTEAGRAEMYRQQGLALETVDPYAPRGFQTGLALASLLTRSAFLEHLRRRREALLEHQRIGEGKLGAAASSPPHVTAMLAHWQRMISAELGWLDELLASVEEGWLEFAGEHPQWRPAPDDPGWDIVAEKRRYRELLGWQ